MMTKNISIRQSRNELSFTTIGPGTTKLCRFVAIVVVAVTISVTTRILHYTPKACCNVNAFLVVRKNVHHHLPNVQLSSSRINIINDNIPTLFYGLMIQKQQQIEDFSCSSKSNFIVVENKGCNRKGRISSIVTTTQLQMSPDDNSNTDFITSLMGFFDSNKSKNKDSMQSKENTLTTKNADNTANDDEAIAYDLAIIGGGVVGASAALTAAASMAVTTTTIIKEVKDNSDGTTTTVTNNNQKKILLLDSPKASGMLYNTNTKEDLSLGGPTGLFSKALRDTSKRINVMTLRGMGLREDSVWNEIINNCVDLASSNAQDIVRQLHAAKVIYQQGFVRFESSTPMKTTPATTNEPQQVPTPKLLVTYEDGTNATISAKNILICTGSKPFLPSNVPFDGVRIFDSDSINTLQYLPKSIAITGSGIIAVEFAKIFRNLGADVTLIIRDNIPRNALMKIGLDKDVAATLVADLVRSGIKFVRGAQVKSFDVPTTTTSSSLSGSNQQGSEPSSFTGPINNVPIRITLEAAGGKGNELPTGVETEIKCDAYLAAVGRIPNTADLNLDTVGIDVDQYGGIMVNSQLRTTCPSGTVYAAGDVLGRPFLASIGVAQARAAVQNILATTDMTASDDSSSSSMLQLPLNECPADDPSCDINGISQAGESFDPASLASNPFAFPTGVWSSPEASYYGLSVEQAKERGMICGEALALYAECLRGRVFSPNGLLKLVYEKPFGRIVGVHICGEDACELIHYGMEIVKARRTIIELSQVMFSAVTFHEMYRIAAQAALDEKGARERRAAAGRALAQRNRMIREK